MEKKLGRKIIDLTGQRFGRLTVIEISEIKNHKTYWYCQCDCGNKIIVNSSNLKTGHTKSCGCLKYEVNDGQRFYDLTGQRFGRLVVNKRADDNISLSGRHSTMWECTCDCGNIVNINAATLKNGRSTSCGCYRSELISLRTTKDLTGQKFGKLTVLYQVENRIYKNGQSKVSWHCRCDCGNECNITSNLLLTGSTHSCGCIKSHGENKIKCYLSNINVNYETQKTFDDLYGIQNGKLSYDFYLPQYNLLIEYQGEQHEKPINFFGGEEQFLKQQEHDRIKREYAENNGYKLLEIWYLDYNNIDEILNKYLNLEE